MDKDNFEQDEMSLITTDSFSEAFSTFAEQCTAEVISFFDSDDLTDVWGTITDISADLLKSLKILSVIQKARSVPDKLFMRKVERYCRGLITIPESKRIEYVAKIGKKRFNNESVFVLGVLNKIEEQSKIDYLVKLFSAKIEETIDDETYRRLMILVDRTMFSDIQFLLENIKDNEVIISNDAEQGLMASGWMNYVGQSWGTATEYGHQLYKYIGAAKRFCEIINEY